MAKEGISDTERVPQVDFVFGYSLPLSACVKKLPGGRAELTLPFSTPLKNVVVDDLTVRVCSQPKLP